MHQYGIKAGDKFLFTIGANRFKFQRLERANFWDDPDDESDYKILKCGSLPC